MKTETLRSILLASLLQMLFVAAIAQEQPSLRTRAQQMFERLEYYNAAQLYSSLAESKKPRTSDFERLAESYYRIGLFELSENWYARAAQQEDFSQEGLQNYAEVLKMNGRYDEAKKRFEEYQTKYGTSEYITLAIAGADSAQHWMAHPTGHKIRGDSTLNTDLSEFGAIPTPDGVIYAGEPKVQSERSGMTGQAYLKIFSANKDRTGQANHPTIMDEVFNQADYHVGPVATNPQGDVFYVTRTHPGKAWKKYREDGRIWWQSNLELKIYTKDNNGWIESDFPYNDVKAYSLGHATLSDDGNTLYYASDMPGGHGGVDIWYSERLPDGSWGAPHNAGPTINSLHDEVFPSIKRDTLFYSSNGFSGMGGLDIYSAVGSRSSFADRRNVGYPLNSPADDFAYVSWGNSKGDIYGYLSSNRPGGIGSDDIYTFSKVQPTFSILLKGILKNKENGESLPHGTITLFDHEENIISKKRGDEDGRFEFTLDPETSYFLGGSLLRYYPDSIYVGAVPSKIDTTIQVELHLQPIFEVATKFELKNIYYDFDKYDIRPDAAKVLNELVQVLRDNPTLKIELSSHTDSRGSAGYNVKLSQRRAQSAVDYIVERGIARDRIVPKGYGDTRLVNNCHQGIDCTEDQHQANRRTEIEVLAF